MAETTDALAWALKSGMTCGFLRHHEPDGGDRELADLVASLLWADGYEITRRAGANFGAGGTTRNPARLTHVSEVTADV